MLVETSLGALVAGEKVTLSPGDTLRVKVGFKYSVAQNTVVTLRACPYQYRLSILDRIGGSCSEADIELERATTSRLAEATVDMPVVAASDGGIADGTYGLITEILGTDVSDKIDDCLVITGNPASIWELLPTLGMVLIMSMMVNTMEKT